MRIGKGHGIEQESKSERKREEKKHEVQNRCDFIVPKNNNESSIYCINETCLEIDVKSSKMNSKSDEGGGNDSRATMTMTRFSTREYSFDHIPFRE